MVTEDVYKVVAGLSIGSAVLMFAFKDSLENVFGTFTVLMDKPFELGDWITVDDVDGTVERVGFRSTRVRTFYHSVITVPNRHFISAKVDNWGSRKFRRVKTTLGLTYDTPPEKVEAFCEAVRALIREHPYTRKDYYHVYFNDFGASSLDVMLYCFLETPDWSMELRERHRLFADILSVAESLKVSFAFPSTSVYMVSPEELEHPNRPLNQQEAVKLGRELGEQIAAETMRPYGDNKPGKVKFVQQNSPLASPGGEGDG
jgi:MscS family membrane protein